MCPVTWRCRLKLSINAPIHFLLCHFSSKENTRETYLDIWDSHVPGRDLRKMPALGKAELNKELDLKAHGAAPRVRGLWFHGFGFGFK